MLYLYSEQTFVGGSHQNSPNADRGIEGEQKKGIILFRLFIIFCKVDELWERSTKWVELDEKRNAFGRMRVCISAEHILRFHQRKLVDACSLSLKMHEEQAIVILLWPKQSVSLICLTAAASLQSEIKTGVYWRRWTEWMSLSVLREEELVVEELIPGVLEARQAPMHAVGVAPRVSSLLVRQRVPLLLVDAGVRVPAILRELRDV